jgi:hypothetical protein
MEMFSPAVVPMLNFDRQADIEIEVDKSEKRVVLRHISGVAKLGNSIYGVEP